MQTTTKHTVENLDKLNERLAVIDNAQKNITDLASQVTSLQDVLSNKQTRGAFGQGRMEAIVQDGLPKGAYEFQHTLKNGKRPDCVVFLPDQRPLVIDAKFPLEAVTALRDAKSEDERKFAARQVRQDVMKHVTDISDRYLIAGETQDIALMFVPSESVYAELHDGFDDVVQKAYRLQVMLVSPTLLMLAIQVIQQIQKDARMREAADQIHDEVGHLMNDVSLLGDRVRKLQSHFNAVERGRAPGARSRSRRSRSAATASGRSSSSEERRAGRRRGAGVQASGGRVIRSLSVSWPLRTVHVDADRRRGCRHKPDMTANSSMTAAERHPARSLARRARRLSQAARADRPVPRLLGRAAARAVRLDAGGVDAPVRRRSRAPSACSRWSARPTR